MAIEREGPAAECDSYTHVIIAGGFCRQNLVSEKRRLRVISSDLQPPSGLVHPHPTCRCPRPEASCRALTREEEKKRNASAQTNRNQRDDSSDKPLWLSGYNKVDTTPKGRHRRCGAAAHSEDTSGRPRLNPRGRRSRSRSFSLFFFAHLRKSPSSL